MPDPGPPPGLGLDNLRERPLEFRRRPAAVVHEAPAPAAFNSPAIHGLKDGP